MIACLGEISVYDPGKKAVRPIRVDAVTGSVKLLHGTPHAAAMFLDGYLKARDALARNLGHMLHIVKESDRVVIGPEQ